jgi:hypothetical protein
MHQVPSACHSVSDGVHIRSQLDCGFAIAIENATEAGIQVWRSRLWVRLDK